jgi:hypothetical protein
LLSKCNVYRYTLVAAAVVHASASGGGGSGKVGLYTLNPVDP